MRRCIARLLPDSNQPDGPCRICTVIHARSDRSAIRREIGPASNVLQTARHPVRPAPAATFADHARQLLGTRVGSEVKSRRELLAAAGILHRPSARIVLTRISQARLRQLAPTARVHETSRGPTDADPRCICSLVEDGCFPRHIGQGRDVIDQCASECASGLRLSLDRVR
jgi:hypothetical protein